MPTFEFMVLDTRGKGDHTQVEAIATGQLAAIPALASRLAQAEQELAALEEICQPDEAAAG